MLVNFLSDNKSFEELPVAFLLLAVVTVPELLIESSSFEQETNKTNPIVSIAIIFFTFYILNINLFFRLKLK